MWTPTARRKMIEAAKHAGLSMVTLVSEPRCALAFLIDRWTVGPYQHLRPPLDIGDLILVADLGSGTGDCVLYRLLGAFGRDCCLEEVKNATGEICGSQKINDYLLELLVASDAVKHMGGLKTLCFSLGISVDTFKEQALREIEEQKVTKFQPGQTSRRYKVDINGSPDVGADDIEDFQHVFSW